VCRDSSVGIVNRHGLEVQGIESQQGRDFPNPLIPTLEGTQPPGQWVSASFPGINRPGRGEVKERVEL
jgi:hypothetical protein